MGTVSIYSYSGYGGLFQAYSRVSSYSSETSLIGDLYYNLSSAPVPLYGMNVSNFKVLSNSRITGWTQNSPTEFDVNVSYNGPFALFFKEGFNSNWIALNATGVPIKDHFEADGYGNGWIISNNTSSIKIVYKGATVYAGLVTTTVVIPFAMLASFAVLYIGKHSKRNRRHL